LGTAFIGRCNAFIDAEPLIENRIWIIDLATAGAGKIAAKQRLQHQHQRIALYTLQMLGNHIGANSNRLAQWNGHDKASLHDLREFGFSR